MEKSIFSTSIAVYVGQTDYNTIYMYKHNSRVTPANSLEPRCVKMYNTVKA